MSDDLGKCQDQESVGRPEVQVQHILAVPALVGLVAAPALVAALLPVDRERKKPSAMTCRDLVTFHLASASPNSSRLEPTRPPLPALPTAQHLENGLSSCFIRLDALATEIAGGTGLAASAYHHRFWNRLRFSSNKGRQHLAGQNVSAMSAVPSLKSLKYIFCTKAFLGMTSLEVSANGCGQS